MVEAWRAGDEELKIEGSESPREVADRQIPVIDEIKQMKEELILICMHGRALGQKYTRRAVPQSIHSDRRSLGN